jgi:hypothetical protein
MTETAHKLLIEFQRYLNNGKAWSNARFLGYVRRAQCLVGADVVTDESTADEILAALRAIDEV